MTDHELQYDFTVAATLRIHEVLALAPYPRSHGAKSRCRAGMIR
jgi:hypothetical protein